MLGLRRSWVLALALVGCGGQATPPALQPQPSAPAPKADPVVEAPDLSPVAAPSGLFVVGRLKRAASGAETLARWAGLPLGVRDLLPFAGKDLESALAWDAPVELAVAVAPSGRRGVAVHAFSVGLTSVEAAQSVARQQGYELKREAPQTYVFGLQRLTCAIAPSLGPTVARLVCSRKGEDLELLLPFMTRGLPTTPMGEHDLELVLDAQPLKQRFATELGSARLLAGFAIRELAQDAPRFDRALSDAAYAVADEVVALVHDLDKVRLQANVDDKGKVLDLELSAAFSDTTSFSGGVIRASTRYKGPPPAKFDELPSDAEGGSYTLGRLPNAYDGLRTGLTELADAYLEHEKIGKATRERVGRLIGLYLSIDGVTVSAEGSGAPSGAVRPEQVKDPSAGWLLTRVENASPLWRGGVADLAGLLGDRELRALIARRTKADAKTFPAARLVPLKAAGVPAGTRGLLVKFPKGMAPALERRLGLGSSGAKGDSLERVVVVVPVGTDIVFGLGENAQDLANRLGAYLSGKGPTLKSRLDLAPIRAFNVHAGAFESLARLLASFGQSTDMTSSLPHHGQTPMFMQVRSEESKGTVEGRVKLSIPSDVFEDLPGLIPLLASAVMKGQIDSVVKSLPTK